MVFFHLRSTVLTLTIWLLLFLWFFILLCIYHHAGCLPHTAQSLKEIYVCKFTSTSFTGILPVLCLRVCVYTCVSNCSWSININYEATLVDLCCCASPHPHIHTKVTNTLHLLQVTRFKTYREMVVMYIDMATCDCFNINMQKSSDSANLA